MASLSAKHATTTTMIAPMGQMGAIAAGGGRVRKMAALSFVGIRSGVRVAASGHIGVSSESFGRSYHPSIARTSAGLNFSDSLLTCCGAAKSVDSSAVVKKGRRFVGMARNICRQVPPLRESQRMKRAMIVRALESDGRIPATRSAYNEQGVLTSRFDNLLDSPSPETSSSATAPAFLGERKSLTALKFEQRIERVGRIELAKLYALPHGRMFCGICAALYCGTAVTRSISVCSLIEENIEWVGRIELAKLYALRHGRMFCGIRAALYCRTAVTRSIPTIFDFRFLTLFGVAGSLLGAVLCFLKGCVFVGHSYRDYIRACIGGGVHSSRVILYLVEAVDVYLMGTVMLIFGMGLYELFVNSFEVPAVGSDPDGSRTTKCDSNLFGLFHLRERPKWLEIRSLDELKTKLGHVIVMILLVGMFEKSKRVIVHTSMDFLCFSASILLSSGALYLLSMLHGNSSQG